MGSNITKPIDTDGDGIFDVLESSTKDADGDGTPDEADKDANGPAKKTNLASTGQNTLIISSSALAVLAVSALAVNLKKKMEAQ